MGKFRPSHNPIMHASFQVKGGNQYDDLKLASTEVRALREKYGEKEYPRFPDEGWQDNIILVNEPRATEERTRMRGIKRSGKVR
jgi:hypothetical protein